MVLFFALFGFLFLSTQYLQFVLGYSPSAAGVRMLPVRGGDDRRGAALGQARRRASERKRVVDRWDAVLRDRPRARRDDHDRQRLRPARDRDGARWVSGWDWRALLRPNRSWARCRRDRANIGSAVNDTTRELGGALGVAIVGSIVSSLYGSRLDAALPADVPAPRPRRPGSR